MREKKAFKELLVISRCEDEPYIETYTKEEFTKLLNAGEYSDYTFLDHLPSMDLNYFPGRSLLVLEGKLLKAIPIETVTSYKLG